MVFDPPVQLNIADWLLDARIREGRGERIALRTDRGEWSYNGLSDLANRFGNLLLEAGVEPEQRVIVALPDGPEFAAALFGALKIGAVVVMVNPAQPRDAIDYFLDYTRAKVAVVARDAAGPFPEAAGTARYLKRLLVLGDPTVDKALESASTVLETFPSHRDDPAIWLFSGGTTGRPKAVVQPHRSYAFTTVAYGQGLLGLTEDDVTLSVPKLYFGYAMGSNLFFPLSVGASAVLFPEPATADAVFDRIERHKPTVLITVPKMVHLMVDHPAAKERDLTSLRIATSAGEALPVELHRKWDETFGVDLLDGLGTAEMWHVFLSNRPGSVRRGTLGQVVPGFEVEVRDEDGEPVPDGEVGMLWVKGGARAIAYWQRQERTEQAFRGDWYVSGDMVVKDADGYFTYCGRADDMLKVGGKWLSPKEVEGCLLGHPAVADAAVVGVTNDSGLTVPRACVVLRAEAAGSADADRDGLAAELQAFVRERLEPYKYPREVVFLDALPRTHLGKVDRAALRSVG